MSTGSNITSAAQLEGKTIAVDALGSFSELGTDEWLDKEGAVKVIAAPFATLDVNSTQPALDNAFRHNALSKPLKASAMVTRGTS